MVHRNSDSEVIVVDTSKREVRARGFTAWHMGEFRVKQVEKMELFSVVQEETREIVEF